MTVELWSEEDRNAFLTFSDQLYTPQFRTEDQVELEQILMEQHPLSHYFQVVPLVVKEGEVILSRAVVTLYPDDPVAYVGYFESKPNQAAAADLFAQAEAVAREAGKTSVEGPLNASFWLGYRLKVDHFDKQPYFTELYQQPYYSAFWEQNGYRNQVTYYSNHYVPVDQTMKKEKYSHRYQQFLAKGYQIKSPTKQTIDEDFLAVAELIQERFRTFPVFKGIKREEFIALFGKLKQILQLRYVKLAYNQVGTLVGFLISVPDYGTLLNKKKLGMRTILRFLWKKYTTRNYVILYMGVKEGHEGLGSALVYALMDEYQEHNIRAISSYIQAGKVSGSYAFPSVKQQSQYRYFRKEL